MIGYYNYTIILTFMSLISALAGIVLAIDGQPLAAVVCLALSGFFDMLDGPVARTKSDRSDDERLFGIQLDSLCDLVAFGVLPAVICYTQGVEGPIGTIALVFFVAAGVIRLCYFNVLETNKFFSDDGPTEKIFIGLPITSSAVILPLTFVVGLVLTPAAFNVLLTLVMLITGVMYIANFKMHKPKISVLIVLCFVVLIAIAVVAFVKIPGIDLFVF